MMTEYSFHSEKNMVQCFMWRNSGNTKGFAEGDACIYLKSTVGWFQLLLFSGFAVGLVALGAFNQQPT